MPVAHPLGPHSAPVGPTGPYPACGCSRAAQRRAAIEHLGAVAAKIGRSRSAVFRYRSGETNELCADASKRLTTVKAQDIMKRAGVLRPDGTPRRAIRVRGGVLVRNGADEGYDDRACTHPRFRELGHPVHSSDESRELASALANDDHARGVALLERHAPLDYPENKGFDKYSDQFGFHFDQIDSVHVDWI